MNAIFLMLVKILSTMKQESLKEAKQRPAISILLLKACHNVGYDAKDLENKTLCQLKSDNK